MSRKLPYTSPEPFRTTLKRFCIVIIFSIAFAYIEAAVVVYLRTIFHPSGFTFPLTEFGISPLWQRILLTEIAREAATIVLMLSASYLFGKNNQQRFAFFLTIFAVWDIFYYIWLRVLIDWPSSITDWDILFLIPVAWAGPVLAPLIISLTLLAFAVIILHRSSCEKPIRPTLAGWLLFILAALIVVLSFCIAGLHIAEPDFKSHFHWPLFAAGLLSAIVLFAKHLLKPK
jgi:multisubunit Na+/H+ antiporter MnhC subunit